MTVRKRILWRSGRRRWWARSRSRSWRRPPLAHGQAGDHGQAGGRRRPDDHGGQTKSNDDDGIGFDVARLADTPAGGHVGLLLLRDLVTTAGGTLELDSSPGRGTRVHLEVPAG
jgi:two-component sensor histidine kinase